MSEITFLHRNDLVFFCGSGISLSSHIPGTQEILFETCKIFFPQEISQEEINSISNTIQPEIFYERLLYLTNNNDACLHLWKSLNDDNNHPNLNHLFIVKYSFLNRVPVITTNFDLMFEKAAEILGIKYKVLLPNDDFNSSDNETLYILKVHGSLGSGDNATKELSITMTSLTKINSSLIKYLYSLMKEKHLCIVGYSGRDLDLYPYIREYSHPGGKRIFWINRFRNGSISLEKADECAAEKVFGYPEEIFREYIQSMLGKGFFGIESYSKQTCQIPDKRKIHTLSKDLARLNLINEQEKKLLYIMVLHSVARYREAYDYAINILNEDFISHLSEENKLLFYTQLAKLSHENTKYESCKKFSKEIRNISNGNISTIEYLGYDFIGMVFHDEALRMGIVKPIYFSHKKDIETILYTILMFMSTIINFKIKLLREKVSFDCLPSWIQHEYIEHKIRFYSLLQAVLISLEKFSILDYLRKPFVKCLVKKWDKLKLSSTEFGYASGIANSGKYKNRLSYNVVSTQEVRGIFDLTTSSTGKEIMYRDDADRELRKENIDQAEIFFREALTLSRESGNLLNSLKALEGLLFIHKKYKKIMTVSDKELYLDLLSGIEGKELISYYTNIYNLVFSRE